MYIFSVNNNKKNSNLCAALHIYFYKIVMKKELVHGITALAEKSPVFKCCLRNLPQKFCFGKDTIFPILIPTLCLVYE